MRPDLRLRPKESHRDGNMRYYQGGGTANRCAQIQSLHVNGGPCSSKTHNLLASEAVKQKCRVAVIIWLGSQLGVLGAQSISGRWILSLS